MEKTKGKNPNTAEFDFFYNPRFAGERVDFYVDIDVGNDDDVHDRKMSGSPVSFSSLPNTTINDPVFMPSGEDMGYYSLIVSNTTGSPLKLDAVTEIVQNGESNIDLTEQCKSDDNGFSILIPAANYTRDVLIEASIPFSPYVYYKMESKTVTLNAFHNPTTFNLSSQWGNKGATVLKWTIPYPDDDDAVAADRFAVERQLYDSNLPLATALQDFSSKVRNGDIIKSQDEFAVYDSETGWQGNLHYMKPGQGYMLKHNADKEGDVVTFVYPYRTTADIVEMAGAPAYHNVRPTTMNMIVQADGIEAREGELLGTAPSSIDYQANTLQGTTALPKVIDFTDISMMEDGMWYALNGIFLGERRPTARGVYILNRKKVVIK